MKYGFDFGTTNSSIAIKKNNRSEILPIDLSSKEQGVIRTILYFLKRKEVISSEVSNRRLVDQVFNEKEITYEGEQEFFIGQSGVAEYIKDNKLRKPGINRKIYTGRMITLSSGEQMPEHYLVVDYGIGRLVQGIKTVLKFNSYKGTMIFGKFYSLEDLISTFVGEIKKRADKQVGHAIKDIVVGRPVHFSYDIEEDKIAQNRLEMGLRQSGFENIKFVFEPVAAAEQFVATNRKKGQKIFVFDFGGGTLDTAIVAVPNSSTGTTKVLAADGISIGGDLLNADIVEAKLWEYFGYSAKWGDQQLPMPSYIYNSLRTWYNIPGLNNPREMKSLRELKYKNSDAKALDRLIYLIYANLGFDLYEAVEKAKKELSASGYARIILNSPPIEIDLEITREEFESIIKDRVKAIEEVILRTLKKAKITPDKIDLVIKTGGSSLIPVVEDMLTKIFGHGKVQQFETFTSIASGLALID